MTEEQKHKKGPSAWLFAALEWMRRAWDIEWGEQPAKLPVLAVAAASSGTFVGLLIPLIWIFENKEFLSSTVSFFTAIGLKGIADVAFVIILFFVIDVGASLIVGLMIYASSSKRSYISYAWRGLLVVPIVYLVLALPFSLQFVRFGMQ